MKTLNFREEVLFVQYDKYVENDRTAITLICENGEPYMTVTTNIDGVELKEDEVLVKNYSENEGVLEAMIAQGFLEKETRDVKTGWVAVQVAKLIK